MKTIKTMFRLFKKSCIRFLHYFAKYTHPSCIRIFFHRLRGVKIGKRCFIGYGVHIDDYSPNSITIEDGVAISVYSIILAHQYDFENFLYIDPPKLPIIIKPVLIKSGSFIGTRSTILYGVTIGKKCVVGAHSLVINDIPDHQKAYGAPAKAKDLL